MQKSIRSFVLVAIVSLTAATAHAGRWGCNPRPTQPPPPPQSITWTVLNFFGF
jgi:hypothetical protein